ncbi:MAG: histidinol-phosphatase [Alphaproteobacteria bacterium]
MTAVPLDVPQGTVEFAHELADASGEILRRYFRGRFETTRKSDESPVTEADRLAEQAIRRQISETFPDHGIIGEEFGAEREEANFVWVIDPIDGTKSFVTGKPLFGTLIALLNRGAPVLGVIDQPILRERWVGVAGRETLFNDRPIRTRPCSVLSEAMLYATSPHMFKGTAAAAFDRVRERVAWPNYGADCYAYGLVASGFADLVVEADLKLFDFAALVPVITGAGGVMCDWSGDPLSPASAGEVIAAGDAALIPQILPLLRGC